MFDMPVIKTNGFSVISHRKMSDGIYDISAIVTVDDRNGVAASFREATKGRMAMIKGTYRTLPSSGDKRCRFVAGPSSTFKAYADSASMVSLGNGQFVDTAENIWSVLEDGGQRHLVLQSSDDLAEILESFKMRKGAIGVTSTDMAKEVQCVTGDFASMIEPDGTLVYGFIGRDKQGTVLYDSVNKKEHRVDSARVVEAEYLGNQSPDVATLQSGDLAVVWAYLSKVFPPEYISKYKAAVGA